ncbi:MAG: hypothetical protein M3O46_14040, partial [Myxococcota bacterium]|nr:hypothetical protein [Myxococcota bacterium]
TFRGTFPPAPGAVNDSLKALADQCLYSGRPWVDCTSTDPEAPAAVTPRDSCSDPLACAGRLISKAFALRLGNYSEAEIATCIRLSGICATAESDASFANATSSDAYPVSKGGDPNYDLRKRLRHALWSTIMSYQFGVEPALEFTEAHELGHPDSGPVRALDEWRNMMGVRLGQDLRSQFGGGLSPQQVAQHVAEAASQGGFG